MPDYIKEDHSNKNDDQRSYILLTNKIVSLISFLPYHEWQRKNLDHRIREMFLVPKNKQIEIRNQANGVAG